MLLYHIERIIHSVKTALACLIGFSLIKFLHTYLIFDQWVIVTILVVMCAQISVGGIFYKSTLRLLGTLLGSLLAVFVILFFGNNTFIFAGTIALAGMVFSFIATSQKNYSDIGTLGAVTTAIILINPNPTLALSVERFLEITLGIVIATLISQFILPIHARNHLRRNQAESLRLLNEYYSLAIADTPAEKEKITTLDESIVQLLLTQRKLAKEARRELLGSKFEPTQFKQLLECEKGLLRSIDVLNRLYNEHQIRDYLQTNPEWQQLNKQIQDIIQKISQQIEKPQFPPPKLTLPSISLLQEKLTPQLNDSTELKHLETVFFCTSNILNRLDELLRVIMSPQKEL